MGRQCGIMSVGRQVVCEYIWADRWCGSMFVGRQCVGMFVGRHCGSMFVGRQCGSMWAEGNKVCVGVCLWADSVGVCRQTCNVGVCLWEDRWCGSMFVDRKVVWEYVFG